MRAFVAVDLSGRSDPEGPARPSEHLTLQFLGELGADRVELVRARLKPVAADHGPFALTIEGIGAFPSRDAPRVVWQGVTRGRAEVVRLAEAVRQALAPVVGGSPEPFVPHVTWFRVRSEATRRAAREALRGVRPPPAPRTVGIDAFLLRESRLGAGAAVHRTVEAFRLVGPTSGAPEGPSARTTDGRA